MSNALSQPASTSLSKRISSEAPKLAVPTWGSSITASELITLMLQREGTREEALDMLAMTLADLGIHGEEIAHLQNRPGICHDCSETDGANLDRWASELKRFRDEPFSYGESYLKKNGPAKRIFLKP